MATLWLPYLDVLVFVIYYYFLVLGRAFVYYSVLRRISEASSVLALIGV